MTHNIAAVDAKAAYDWCVTDHDADHVLLKHVQAGDMQPDDWADRLTAALHCVSNVVAVGAKRLDAAGKVFSMGEFVIHPKGFWHLGKGLPPQCYRFAVEVDAIVGGVMAIKRLAFEQAGGLDAMNGPLGALSLCLNLRKQGGRILAVPQVVVTDDTTPTPTADEADAFAQQWGFDWRGADLDRVRAAHVGTGLLWNERLHTAAMPFDKYEDRPAMHWVSYRDVPAYRQRADYLVSLARQLAPDGCVLDLGCGDGLFSHLMAVQGLKVIGVDPETQAIEQAKTATSGQTYPGADPTFITGYGDALNLPDTSMDVLVMFDVIEHLPNPTSVLREARRVLKPGAALLLSTPQWQFEAWSDPVYHITEYTMDELIGQVTAVTGMKLAASGQIKGAYRDLVVAFR